MPSKKIMMIILGQTLKTSKIWSSLKKHIVTSELQSIKNNQVQKRRNQVYTKIWISIRTTAKNKEQLTKLENGKQLSDKHLVWERQRSRRHMETCTRVSHNSGRLSDNLQTIKYISFLINISFKLSKTIQLTLET